ncbi:hypothetical protein [Mycolicibacterium sp. CBMA 226]|nr:hypothetical protein [Mycolicibacterium sp. CBMA 226]
MWRRRKRQIDNDHHFDDDYDGDDADFEPVTRNYGAWWGQWWRRS